MSAILGCITRNIVPGSRKVMSRSLLCCLKVQPGDGTDLDKVLGFSINLSRLVDGVVAG